ncbi:MAG: hypothetical protein BWY72_02504 [Bacteroidetes bacterium ADurb.Bin416]|nr:MAG: hypothetical protein BWY72_02504 [Bacteroidetes bacterium ADurb.Bin416]
MVVEAAYGKASLNALCAVLLHVDAGRVGCKEQQVLGYHPLNLVGEAAHGKSPLQSLGSCLLLHVDAGAIGRDAQVLHRPRFGLVGEATHGKAALYTLTYGVVLDVDADTLLVHAKNYIPVAVLHLEYRVVGVGCSVAHHREAGVEGHVRQAG